MCYVLGMVNPFKRFMKWLTMRGDLEITEVDPVKIINDPDASPELKQVIREAQDWRPLSEGQLDRITAETEAIIKATEGKPN